MWWVVFCLFFFVLFFVFFGGVVIDLFVFCLYGDFEKQLCGFFGCSNFVVGFVSLFLSFLFFFLFFFFGGGGGVVFWGFCIGCFF